MKTIKKINIFLSLSLSLSLSCNLNELNVTPDKEQRNITNVLNFFSGEKKVKETSTKALVSGGSSSSSVFYINSEDIKKIDNINPSDYKNKLPSQISIEPSFKPETSDKLKGIEISLKENSLKKDDKTGSYSYEVVLSKSGKQDQLKVTYFFQNTNSYYTQILSSIMESDIKNVDDISGNISKLPTDVSVPSSPTFKTLSKSGLDLKINLINFENGDSVRRSNKEGKYTYKVRIEKDGVYRDFIINYRFQSEDEKKYSEIDPKIQDDLEESIFNTISESDIKSKDGLTFLGNTKPTTKGSPNFTALGYNIRSLKSVVFQLLVGTVQKKNGAGTYSYQVDVRYSLSSGAKNLSKRVLVTYVVDSEISGITENHIKAVDGVTPSLTTLPSDASNPPVFDTSGNVGGVSGVTLSLLDGSLRVLDGSGLYEYKVQVSKSGKSKQLLIIYSNFETSSGRKERLDKRKLRSLTVADIKGVDGIVVDGAVLPSTVGSPVFRIPVGGLRGLLNLTISATGVRKDDNAGSYRYTANLEKHGEKRTLTISYNGYKNSLTANQERDLSRLNQFTESDIKSMDDITVDSTNLPPDKDPTFTRKVLHGFSALGYTMTLVGGTRKKDDAAGTYGYRVRLSSVGTNQTRNLDILYNGFLTGAQKILNDDKTKLQNFTEADVKQWDGINVSASVLPSSLADKPTFRLPIGAYKGLTGFTVEFVGESASKNDKTGAYFYEVVVKNATGTVSKSIVVSYTGFATINGDQAKIEQFTEADIKQWDNITPDINTAPSTLPDKPTFTLPRIYKGLSNFTVEVLGLPLVDDRFGNYKYITAVKNSSGNARKIIVVSYGYFESTIYKNMSLWKTLTGHTGYVRSVSYSPDGTKIASGSTDRTIRIWDASTGNVLKTLRGHSDRVYSVSYSPDGTKIASGSKDRTIRIWDASTGNVLRTLRGHSTLVTSVSYSPDGTKIASGSNDDNIKIWDASTGALLKNIDTGYKDINSVSFSPDGTKIASGDDGYNIKIWDASTGALLKTIYYGSRVTQVSYSPDGTKIASISSSFTKIWDVSTGTRLSTLTGYVRSVSFSPDGTKIALGGGDNRGLITIWDVSTGLLLKTLTGHRGRAYGVSFSPDGTKIASSADDRTIKIWR